jgi:hypothetical protein
MYSMCFVRQGEPTLEELADMNLEGGDVASNGPAASGEGTVAGFPEPTLRDPVKEGPLAREKAVDALGNMMEDWLVHYCCVALCVRVWEHKQVKRVSA